MRQQWALRPVTIRAVWTWPFIGATIGAAIGLLARAGAPWPILALIWIALTRAAKEPIVWWTLVPSTLAAAYMSTTVIWTNVTWTNVTWTNVVAAHMLARAAMVLAIWIGRPAVGLDSSGVRTSSALVALASGAIACWWLPPLAAPIALLASRVALGLSDRLHGGLTNGALGTIRDVLLPVLLLLPAAMAALDGR
jgi:hypothetical protein